MCEDYFIKAIQFIMSKGDRWIIMFSAFLEEEPVL